MNKEIRLFSAAFVTLALLVSCSSEKDDDPDQGPGSAAKEDGLKSDSGVTRIGRLKLWCDPYAPAGYVRLKENGRATVDKFENVIVTPATEEQVAEQKKECLRQRIRAGMEPLSRYGPGPDGEDGADGAGPGTDDPGAPVNGGGDEGAAPESPGQIMLIGPPDGTAYADPDHDMWFGMLWQPVPGASHMLCITGRADDCPDDIRRAVIGGAVDRTLDFYSEQVTGDNAVRRMPRFCYDIGSCYWSVAACVELAGGLSWDCQYAPFWEVRVLTE